MTIHIILLVIQSISAILSQLNTVVPSVCLSFFRLRYLIDLTVQFLICYICFTLGASDQLTRFDCFLIEDGQGNFIVKYKLKEGIPQAIGEAYVADVASENTESEYEEVEENSFM